MELLILIVGIILTFVALGWVYDILERPARTREQRKKEELNEALREYGGVLDACMVVYEGGHPEFPSRRDLALVLTGHVPLAMQAIDQAAVVYFTIPYDKIRDISLSTGASQTTIWSSDLPIPITVGKSNGSVSVAFVNDVGDISVLGFSPSQAGKYGDVLARSIATSISQAIYAWKKTSRGVVVR